MVMFSSIAGRPVNFFSIGLKCVVDAFKDEHSVTVEPGVIAQRGCGVSMCHCDEGSVRRWSEVRWAQFLIRYVVG